jgi:Ca2+-binding EF-hand superfamily protein
MFDVYDQNKDKSIDRKEIELIVKAILKMNKKDLAGDQTLDTKIDELFEKLDDNENQKISKDEFINNCADNMFLREILAPKI